MIKVEAITKEFKQKPVLEKVNCQLSAGKSYAIIGKSGAGKTTFLNILSGLEEPSSGSVTFDDLPVNAKNQKQLYRNHFGFVFQNFGLIDNETVKQNLAIGLANQKHTKQSAQVAMQAVLERVGLGKLSLKQKVYTLSGGEQQRIALARAILKKPDVIFADEPTGSLDTENSEVVLNSLLNDFGPDATVIIATHSPQIWQQCDYVIEIKDQTIHITENERIDR
ncbi:ATP-binding cassette domain-containing protein [Lactobacillus sp. ESL0684]|uniref:ATP-binding cassette domain-containing protein n=1 Tax=Lactobacillus sp. ESL0684 TaxID=2983213 RepID=UPI0023F73CA7|nr:ATP-binding cassette domain-containing protein [Lactobacillus sp. ESL0684]WEV43082.1 ATP-binding cassette domain-containing protein [Lactobacillus sp. ESL0684]